jgi:hypothetical protein
MMDGVFVAFFGGAGLTAKQNVSPALRHLGNKLKMASAHHIMKRETPVLKPAPAGKDAAHLAVEHHNAGGSVVDKKPQFDIGFGQFLGVHFEGIFEQLPLPVSFTICVAYRGQNLSP